MRFRVVWTRSAENDLARIWVGPVDRAAVTSSCEVIDRLLARSPEAAGVGLFDTVRSLYVDPLGVDFEPVSDDLIVYVLSAWTAAE